MQLSNCCSIPNSGSGHEYHSPTLTREQRAALDEVPCVVYERRNRSAIPRLPAHYRHEELAALPESPLHFATCLAISRASAFAPGGGGGGGGGSLSLFVQLVLLWDPVENAALMPWLAITAYIHSIMVQEKRGMLRFWNVVLVAGAFSLSIFGTFLTRSGILSSVHSFVQSSIGWWFVGFLRSWRSSDRWRCSRGGASCSSRATTSTRSVVSREAVMLFNNLLLAGITLTVLWGVLYPIVTDTFTGQRVSLRPPGTTSSRRPSACRSSP